MKGLNIADWSIKHMQIVAFFVIAIILIWVVVKIRILLYVRW